MASLGSSKEDRVEVKENSSVCYFPNKNEVFYNPVQVLNRDLSITMIRQFGETLVKEREEKLKKKEIRKEWLSNDENATISKTGMRHPKKGVKEPNYLAEASEKLSGTDWSAEVDKLHNQRIAWRKAVKDGEEKLPERPPPGLKILDCLAASGLRSMRYFKEIKNVDLVAVNDLDSAAIELAENNIQVNGVDPSVVRTRVGDGTMLCYEARTGVETIRDDPRGKNVVDPDYEISGKFDVIDLDPYGSCAPFTDCAVQAISNGGLLCLTSTDMAVLSGNHVDTCFSKYSAMSMHKSGYLHELALRIFLQSVESQANKYGKHIVPLASFGIDFYIRVFVRVYDSPAEVKKSSTKIGYVYQSTGCPSFHVVPTGTFTGKNYVPTVLNNIADSGGVCAETGRPFKVAGPVWIAPLHSQDFVSSCIKRVEDQEERKEPHAPLPTTKRLHGLLTTAFEELPDQPLYYLLPNLCSTLRCTVPPRPQFIAQMEKLGFKVSAQHKEPDAIKTDAPNDVIWDVLRNWVRLHPISAKRAQKGGETWGGKGGLTASMKILETEPKFLCDFEDLSAKSLKGRKKATRFPMNPEKHWGPKARAVGKRAVDEVEDPKDDGGESR
eukprot:CAMPEP_0118635056 /NCGR_PEP_ID=MMETSP0785-20121206/1874_1 /TAXON_ID=91992 /ORGANISM="Bolidomonas pacifica, Strain CCMP 1866" /LENGTH=608 /DNA_ID=CAMNT_0006526067 /DNA_START=62 /DNA_END=1885 /DNA_ORIENTATION=+